MAEMVKKATRESFGEAVTELAAEYPDVVVLDADLAAATKTGIFKKNIRNASSTAASPNAI
jgi:transketolase